VTFWKLIFKMFMYANCMGCQKKENLMADISNEWTHILKKEILMAYISISKTILEQKFPFLVILMAYISWSCDPPKARKHQA